MDKSKAQSKSRAKSKTLSNMTFSAVFAAMIFASITLMAIPNGLGGVIHFGDSLIYVAAAVLPFPYGLFVAAIGPGLFNLIRVPIWLPFTVVIKPIMSLCFGSSSAKHDTILGSKRNMVAPFAAGVINVGLYALANGILGLDARAALPGLVIQSSGSVVFFFIIAAVLDKLKFKQRMRSLGSL